MSPLYVSYYTVGNGYEVEAAHLVRTLETYKLPHHVSGVRRGSTEAPWTWERATQYKAEFIRDMLCRYPKQPLVWLDADARIIQRPGMFDWLDCDLAAHWYRNKELLSGTLYIGPGPAARGIVDSWILCNARRPSRRFADQRNLQDLVEKSRGLKVVNLPPEYTWIDAGNGTDLSARTYGPKAPVILHVQASRRLKTAAIANSSVPETLEKPIV